MQLLCVVRLTLLRYLRHTTSRLRVLQFRLVQRRSSNRVLTKVLRLLWLRLRWGSKLLLLLLELGVLWVAVLRRLPLSLLRSLLLLVLIVVALLLS